MPVETSLRRRVARGGAWMLGLRAFEQAVRIAALVATVALPAFTPRVPITLLWGIAGAAVAAVTREHLSALAGQS